MKRFHRQNTEMQLSEAELASMTADLKDAHNDTLPALKSSIESWNVSATSDNVDAPVGLSRRNFLIRTGLLAAGGLLATTTGYAASATPLLTSKRSSAPSSVRNAGVALDVKVAALAASLENLAVATYGAALTAATQHKLGTVPKAFANFAEVAMGQHKDHAAAWNAIISAAGYDRITAPNAAIGKSIDAAFAKINNIPGVAKLALVLEDAAAATYLEAIGIMSGSKAIETAATIQPVEMQHSAILHFVLGQYPVPQAFAMTTGAATLADMPAVRRR